MAKKKKAKDDLTQIIKRLIEIDFRLMDTAGLVVDDFAYEVDVHERTIRRDVARLTELGKEVIVQLDRYPGDEFQSPGEYFQRLHYADKSKPVFLENRRRQLEMNKLRRQSEMNERRRKRRKRKPRQP